MTMKFTWIEVEPGEGSDITPEWAREPIPPSQRRYRCPACGSFAKPLTDDTWRTWSCTRCGARAT